VRAAVTVCTVWWRANAGPLAAAQGVRP